MRPPDPAEESEVRRMLVSDRDVGFTMLVRRYQPGIYSGARRLMRSHVDAEEIAQDTFLRAYRALDTYDADRIEDLRIPGWLWTIAVNLCRSRWARSTDKPVGIADMPEATRVAEPIDADAWNRRLDALSADQRTAVVLRHVVDLSISDIAQATDRPEGTVKADISRGLNQLRNTLHREELLQ